MRRIGLVAAALSVCAATALAASAQTQAVPFAKGDVAIDAVDGEGHFLEMKDRNVFLYLCAE